MLSDRVFALAVALLGGRDFTFMDVRGLRYRATRDALIVEELEIAVDAGDAFDVAREIVRIGARDLRGQTILER